MAADTHGSKRGKRCIIDVAKKLTRIWTKRVRLSLANAGSSLPDSSGHLSTPIMSRLQHADCGALDASWLGDHVVCCVWWFVSCFPVIMLPCYYFCCGILQPQNKQHYEYYRNMLCAFFCSYAVSFRWTSIYREMLIGGINTFICGAVWFQNSIML